MIAKTDPHIKKAYDNLRQISADKEKRLEYEARQRALYDYNTQMRSGIAQGKQQKLISQVCKKLKKNCSILEIADMLEEEESVIQEIAETAALFAPDYDTDQILHQIKENREA